MIKIPNKAKFTIVAICFGLACFGFLIKLPLPLRKIDTELHALFFFMAAAFLNILYRINKLNGHLLIFGMLFLFGALIEFAQEYSNKLVHKKIHGNFDPQDVKYNLLGLTLFSVSWFFLHVFFKIYKNSSSKRLYFSKKNK